MRTPKGIGGVTVIDQAYYVNLERLTNAMTSFDGIDLKHVNLILTELCSILRACKGVTEFFDSKELELTGKGEKYVCYDNGAASDTFLKIQTEFPGGLTARCMVYHESGTDPWTELEQSRLNTIMHMMLGFLSRNRLDHLADNLSMRDDAGYKTIRYYMRTVSRMGQEKLVHHAAIRFNLKHFSIINQEIGRQYSDEVMHKYVDILEEISGEDGVVCRLGGDNFIALCDQDYLGTVLSHLEGAPVFYGENNERVIVSATAGVFNMDENYVYRGPDDIIERITMAFNVSKNGTKGEIVFANADLEADRENSMRVKKLFPQAMKNDEIQIYYQPKINVQNNMLVGAEALSRWFQEGNLMLPDSYIPVLEQSMDICRLDFYVLERVCRDISRWISEGRQVVRVSVNMSRRHLIEDDLSDRILDIIDMYDVPHEYIEIELTETTTDVEFRRLKNIVTVLQDAGVFTAVDDFGVGYSSLNLIRDIPWDVIKVDKNFVPIESGINTNTRTIMFKNVVNMVREMGRDCVAEGVETKEQVKILRENGCGVAQGFFYDRPLPVTEFEKRLDQKYYPDID
ncbi:MAG: EAL domain-containing protein [Clostridia bacterium]|nr:EAL domain-containing protein [Clostridia bacterium]